MLLDYIYKQNNEIIINLVKYKKRFFYNMYDF